MEFVDDNRASPFESNNDMFAATDLPPQGAEDFVDFSPTQYDSSNDKTPLNPDLLANPENSSQGILNYYSQDSSKDVVDSPMSGGSSSDKDSSGTDDSLKASKHYEPYISLSMSMAANAFKRDKFEPPFEYNNIEIIEAGDYRDPWGKHAIGYKIRCKNNQEVVRRYSEFDSLRQSLRRLLPTIVVPPIPSKHPLIKYLMHPISAETDKVIIGKRKRLLQSFLNHCSAIPEIGHHVVFKKFLNPEYTWKDVLNSPPISILPVNNLVAPPLEPTKPSPLHQLLPAPSSTSRLDSAELQTKFLNLSSISNQDNEDDILIMEKKFAHIEVLCTKHKVRFRGFFKNVKHNKNHVYSLYSLLAELGATYNLFSLDNNIMANSKNLKKIKFLSEGIEKIGNAFDVEYLSTEVLAGEIKAILEEPIEEFIQLLETSQEILDFRKLKKLQFQIIKHNIILKDTRLKSLKDAQRQMKKILDTSTETTERPTANGIVSSGESLDTNISSPGDISLLGETAEIISTQEFETPSFEEEQDADMNESNLDINDVSQTIVLNKKNKKGSSSKKYGTTPPHFLSEFERQQEIDQIEREIVKLNHCFDLVSKDIVDVNKSSLNSLTHVIKYIEIRWDVILMQMTKEIIQWTGICLENWKKAKIAVNNIPDEI